MTKPYLQYQSAEERFIIKEQKAEIAMGSNSDELRKFGNDMATVRIFRIPRRCGETIDYDMLPSWWFDKGYLPNRPTPPFFFFLRNRFQWFLIKTNIHTSLKITSYIISRPQWSSVGIQCLGHAAEPFFRISAWHCVCELGAITEEIVPDWNDFKTHADEQVRLRSVGWRVLYSSSIISLFIGLNMFQGLAPKRPLSNIRWMGPGFQSRVYMSTGIVKLLRSDKAMNTCMNRSEADVKSHNKFLTLPYNRSCIPCDQNNGL